MLFHRIHQKELSVFTYIIGDEQSLTCTVIDPTLDIEPVLRVVETKGYKVNAILETHVHADFISGAQLLKKTLDNRPKIYVSACGGSEWTAPYGDVALKNGDSVTVGSFRFEALFTPGHTPEHLCYKVFHDENLIALLTGDLLFTGGVGRPDLLGDAEAETLAHELCTSLFVTLKTIPDETAIFPAHGAGSLCGKWMSNNPDSTMGHERETNFYFKKCPKYEWIENLLHEIPAAPNAFKWIKEANRTGKLPEINGEPLLIDTRMPQEFAEGHNPGAINIPWTPAFLIWTAMVAPRVPLRIIPPPKAPFEYVRGLLALMGYNDVEPLKLDPQEKVSIVKLEETEPYQIIDVRSLTEWNQGHHPRALWIELADLPGKMKDLNHSLPIALICRTGTRAMIAASLLKREGFKKVVSIMESAS